MSNSIFNSASNSVFSIHPHNHRCFVYKGKPFKVLTSAEHYGAVINADFDYDLYLQELSRTGQNMSRIFAFYRETAESIPGPGSMNTLAPSSQASVLPWERVSGCGQAADGLDKFDLNRWNPNYFSRLKDFVKKCDNQGVVCEIVFFCNPYDQRKYDLFPCSQVSNVNGVGVNIAIPQEFLTLKDPTIVAFQEKFVRKVVVELNQFDNVYYEVCNEPNLQSGSPEEDERKIVAWHSHLAGVIRQTESQLSKRHLVAVNSYFRLKVAAKDGDADMRHDDLSYFENPDVDVVNYHYISAKAEAKDLRFILLSSREGRAGLIWRFLRQRDRYRKPIIFDETFSGVVRGAPERYAINRAEAWETILSGGAGYDNLDWSFTPADETGSGRVAIDDGRKLDGRCLREWLDIFRNLIAQYDLATLIPATGLLPQSLPGYGYAASVDDEGRYILYFVNEKLYQSGPCQPRALTVPVNLEAGSYSARSFDPRTAVVNVLPKLQSDGVARLSIPEFNEDAAVLLEPLR